MVPALIAVVMVALWYSYIALTVIALTSHDWMHVLGWIVLTIPVLLIQWVGIKLLDHFMTFG